MIFNREVLTTCKIKELDMKYKKLSKKKNNDELIIGTITGYQAPAGSVLG